MRRGDLFVLSWESLRRVEWGIQLPILITINSNLPTIDGPRRTYINFMKADWARYDEACDKYQAEAGETRTVEQPRRSSGKQ